MDPGRPATVVGDTFHLAWKGRRVKKPGVVRFVPPFPLSRPLVAAVFESGKIEDATFAYVGRAVLIESHLPERRQGPEIGGRRIAGQQHKIRIAPLARGAPGVSYSGRARGEGPGETFKRLNDQTLPRSS